MPKSKNRGKRHSTPYKHQEMRMRRNIKENIPAVYAAMAIAMHRRHGWGEKRLTQIFIDTQEIWQTMEMKEIFKTCVEETGMILLSDTTARELGIDKGEII